MAFELEAFKDLDGEYLSYLVDQHAPQTAARYTRLWEYFRNPIKPVVGLAADVLNGNSRPYFQAQEQGLPARITGIQRLAGPSRTDLLRKEVVIENDIAWRIHTMVDFLFGKDVTIRSLAADARLAETIEHVVTAMLDANGGVALLQEMALLGAVYGFVDIALRTPAGPAVTPTPSASQPKPTGTFPLASSHAAGRPGSPQTNVISNADVGTDPRGDGSRHNLQRAVEAARRIQLETVEAPRILPILDEDDYRTVRYWVQRYHKRPARIGRAERGWFGLGPSRRSAPAQIEVIEIISADFWQRYEDRKLVAQGPNPLGRLPIVHVQNVAAPGSYEGISDVEPLIPLQDELNTRLSDRANRVTYQSFKMYLGKGIDDFLERPVGPGQMWATHNMDASIEEFGADAGSPSETEHIEQVRQALDKVSGVTPLAAGLIRGNVGNLTSAAALKVLLAGLLARTARKRLTYGAGIKRIVELALDWLDRTAALPSRPQDRRVEIHWPDPLPTDESQTLLNARIKTQLGVPPEKILAELGYERNTQTTERGPSDQQRERTP